MAFVDLVFTSILLAMLYVCKADDHGKINTPPTIHVLRQWVLQDTEPIGSTITTVSATDADDSYFTFGLDVGSSYSAPDQVLSPIPFTIDNITGIVRTNDTLKDRGGTSMFVYVTASDGKVTVKSEVQVIIKDSSAPNNRHIGAMQIRIGTRKETKVSLGTRKAGRKRTPFPIHYNGAGNWPPPKFPNLPQPQSIPARPSVLNPYPSISSFSPARKVLTTTPKTKSYSSSNIAFIPKFEGTFDEEFNKRRKAINYAIGFNKSSEKDATEINVTSSKVDGQVTSSETGPSEVTAAPRELVMILVPVVVLFALIIVVGSVIWLARYKLFGNSSEKPKEPVSPSESNMSDDPSFVLRKWRGPKALSNRYEAWEKENQASPLKKASKDIWEFPRHRIKVFSILGEGCFGQVYKCEAIDIDGIPGPNIVAVKTVKESATESERNDLLQELKVMKTLDPHPNVVRLLGCCTEREPIFVILEYVSGGKLHSYLRNSREERNHGGSCLTSRELTGFVYQIAKGMEYLASKGIIHRDLAARNILIGEDRTCKVADFGFARDIALNQIYERKSEGRFPIRWMAPESLFDSVFSVKSDIWSFGVLMWEIVTLGSTPYPGLRAAEVMKKVREGYRLERPEHCKRELYNIMFYCWDKEPARRPTFTELVSLAENLLLDETDYIELDRFPDHSYYNVLNLSGEKL